MRIAILLNYFPVISETFVLRQITGLLDRGHTVDIYADWPGEDEVSHPEVQNYGLLQRTTYMEMPPAAGYWEMPVWPITDHTWIPGSDTRISNLSRVLRAAPSLARCLTTAPGLTVQALSPAHYGYQASSLSALYRLAALCRRHVRYDVLHAHFGPAGNAFRFARQLWSAPLVVSFHGYDFSSWPRQHGPGVYSRLFESADAITVNSDYTRGRLEALGCPKDKLHKVPVGLDPSDFPFRERRRADDGHINILTVARLEEIKGLEYALRAVAALHRTYPRVQYDIIGEGSDRGRLERLIQELGLNEVVTLHGAQTGAFVRRMMAQAHIFVLSSVTVHGDQEGQGLVLQEVQASGLPVIATRHGALPEGMVPGESGLLVPERDVDALTDALTDLVQHPERWSEMGRRGRQYVERNYNIHALTDRLLEVYKEAVHRYLGASSRRRALRH
ncbi:MAG TPA: glycosyltransferase [Chloroflexota bacterium]|nr:glycosyltransferase [Chloroflexota bacterium]